MTKKDKKIVSIPPPPPPPPPPPRCCCFQILLEFTVDANVIATADVIVVNAVAVVDGASVAATSSGVVVAGVAGFHGYHCLKYFVIFIQKRQAWMPIMTS